MTIEQLRENLAEILKDGDIEGAHVKADDLLLEYIADAEVSRLFNSGKFWYA